jgi:AraC family transcriptional regulator of adaptative response / DNA-3-methyladenine glycosylase II
MLDRSRAPARPAPPALSRALAPAASPALADDARYEALLARDPRFDGVFFVGVSTTGVYCRPICPARTPGRLRCAFFDSPARAEAAGFRACFRCRPEIAPGAAEVDAVDQLAAAAAARIAEGALNERGVRALAAELGVSERHLRRALEARLGASPIALAQSRRLALAKQLLHDTALPLTRVAFAAGYGSVRRFNAAFRAAMGSSPTQVRRARRGEGSGDAGRPGAAHLALRLDYRPPYAWVELLAFLAARAIPGVEVVARDAYHRVVSLGGATGVIAVRPAPGRDALALAASPELVPALMPLVARVRRAFDLDARPDRVASVLGRDPVLAPLVAARPGLRVPGAIDPFEAAVRALLGQQVSVAAATTLAGRLVTALGAPLPPIAASSPRPATLTHRFPTAGEVAAAGPAAIARIGLPAARAHALHALAAGVASGAIRIDGIRALEPYVADLVRCPGIGPWTAHYLALRALHHPDAFPAADLGVRKALGMIPARAAEARAAPWRPFRAYAVLHLWTPLGADRATPTGGDDVEPRDRTPHPAPRRARRPAARPPGDRLAARPDRAARRGRRAGRRVPAGASRASGAGGTRRSRGAQQRARRARAGRRAAR